MADILEDILEACDLWIWYFLSPEIQKMARIQMVQALAVNILTQFLLSVDAERR